MHFAVPDYDQLMREHLALIRDYANAQARCSEQMLAQARAIARLEAEAMRLRAELVKRETALAWAQEDRAALEQAVPGLPKRVALVRQVETLQARVRELGRELQRRELQAQPHGDPAHLGHIDDVEPDLAADLAAADLVICQTGCLSHGAWWRVHDHCRRTGKACVLVDKTDALHIVRIDRVEEGEATTGPAV